MRMTESEYEAARMRNAPKIADSLAPVKSKGRLVARKMNKTEAEYGQRLKARPDVVWCEYEGVTLRLGFDCRYTPDFAVMLADGAIELHEAKGFMRDDALVKIKVAAAQYPFKFVLARKKAGTWEITEVRVDERPVSVVRSIDDAIKAVT